LGECGGSAVVDECGVCDGDGISEGDCDCNSIVEDCSGECNGAAILDECGVCDGDNSSCADCEGVPNGDAVDLGCGCGEPGPSGCDNECESILEFDCAGECDGNAIIDACGYCGGEEIDPNNCVSYNQEIQPIFNNHCISCHSYGGNAFYQVFLTDYNSLMLAESWYNNKTILRVSRDYNIIIIP
jgi:hypothetical protein